MTTRSPNPPEDSCPTRPSLLQRLQAGGDEPSWKEFNDLYGGLIMRFARKAGLTEAEAQEAVQETMISAAKNLPEFRYDPAVSSFKTWLLRLSRWRVTDQLRKRLPLAARSAPADEATARTATIERVADPSGNELDQLWEAEWHRTLLDQAIQTVKTQVDLKQWQIFDLYVLKEWSAREVAKALEVSLPAVYLAKHRVGALLKKEVKRLEAAEDKGELGGRGPAKRQAKP
jgi:RNA polymerase sigma-70 factor (ECF subfamily)